MLSRDSGQYQPNFSQKVFNMEEHGLVPTSDRAHFQIILPILERERFPGISVIISIDKPAPHICEWSGAADPDYQK